MTYNTIKKIATYVGLAGLLLGVVPRESEAQLYRTPTEIGKIIRNQGGEGVKYWEVQRAIQFFQDNPGLFKDLEPLDTSSFNLDLSMTIEIEPFQPRSLFDIGLPAILNQEYKRPRKFLWKEPPAAEEVQYTDPFLKILEFRMREEESQNDPSKPEILPYPRMGDVSLEIRTEENGENVLILQGNNQSYTPDKALEMILNQDIDRVNQLLDQTPYESQLKTIERHSFKGIEVRGLEPTEQKTQSHRRKKQLYNQNHTLTNAQVNVNPAVGVMRTSPVYTPTIVTPVRIPVIP